MASTAPDVALPTVTSSPNSNAQSLSTEQITTIEAPQMTVSTFPTWDAFSTYFSAYQRQTFQLNLVAQKKLGQDGSKADNWQVVVTQHVVTHNHSLDAKTYMSYPQNRRVDDPEVLETVNTLRKAGVKQSKIRSYLTEKAPNKPMTKSDVHNLLTKLKDDANFTAKLNATAQWSTVSTTVEVSTILGVRFEI
ncbi:hypothetical protein BBP00_00008018 [Phytophthora kernoviae]|uniref:Uncharacterized protein n=1 Tax=Phytophthora kernoviae TaxID=325452 RepID=A0A3F2RGJ8_9STRA|nr:hypothetical protein BBP00_00008018 [Phytophthora kernoviae]